MVMNFCTPKCTDLIRNVPKLKRKYSDAPYSKNKKKLMEINQNLMVDTGTIKKWLLITGKFSDANEFRIMGTNCNVNFAE
jgi:hypothetical protein